MWYVYVELPLGMLFVNIAITVFGIYCVYEDKLCAKRSRSSTVLSTAHSWATRNVVPSSVSATP